MKPRMLGPSVYKKIRNTPMTKGQRAALYGQVKGGQLNEALKGLKRLEEQNGTKK